MRAHFIKWLTDGKGAALANADVTLRQQGTANPIPETIFANDTGDNTQLANPLSTDASGKIEFYLDTAKRLDLFVRKSGYADKTFTVDVLKLPSSTLVAEGGVVSTNRPTLNFDALGFNLIDDPTNNETDIALGSIRGFADVADTVPADGQALVWRDAGGGAFVPEVVAAPDLTPYARKDTAQTFTEDQTIEAVNALRLGTSAALTQALVGGASQWSYNARFDGTNWVRLVADNAAAHLAVEANGDLAFYTNTDAGATVGSIITWGEKFRIGKNGYVMLSLAAAASQGLSHKVAGEANERHRVLADGKQEWGPGGAGALDTNLYRSAADTLKTDDNFRAGGILYGVRVFPNGPAVDSVVTAGNGSPEGIVTEQVGSIYLRRDGGAGTSLYVKQSGTGNTGWVGK